MTIDRRSTTDAVILGMDAVTPLGTRLDTSWERLKNGESGITPLTRFQLPDHFPVREAGQVDPIDDLDYPFLTPRELGRWKSPLFRYGQLTVARALERSGVVITPELAPRVAVTFSSALGGVDAVIEADRRLVSTGKLPHPFTNPNACINMIGGKVSMMTGATGPILAAISACATGLASLVTGALLLRQGMADVAVCGAVDFALCETILAGFATMNGTFTPKPGETPLPSEASRPFSIHRRGFVVSEGAGAVIIATRDFATAWGLDWQVEIAGFSLTSDAHHFVAPNLPTVQRCMTESITAAGVSPEDISAVNAHAASTQVGDRVEAQALEAVFGGRVPPVTANKSMIGHLMGAASIVETIHAVQAMIEGVLPPTINFRPDPDIRIDCNPAGKRTLDQDLVLKNAFGFGGCNACVVLKRR